MSAETASALDSICGPTATPNSVAAPKVSAGSIGIAPILVLLLIGLSPFWQTVAMNTGFFGDDALCITNLLSVSTFCVFLLAMPKVLRPPDRLGTTAMILFLCYLLVFAVAFARSLPSLERYSAIDPDISTNIRTYTDRELVVRSLMAMQFLYVLTMFRTKDMLQRLFTVMSASLFVLSCIVIVAVLSDPAVLSTPERSGMTKLTESILGIHYNGASAPYAIAAPLLAFMAIKRGGFWTLNYLLALVSALFLESRTALMLFVGMSVVALIVCGRARALVAAVPLISVVGLSALGPILFAILLFAC